MTVSGKVDRSLVLDIEGMSCGHCVARVRKAIGALPGVGDADVQIGSAKVAYDPAVVSPADVTEAVTRAGYAAHVAGDA